MSVTPHENPLCALLLLAFNAEAAGATHLAEPGPDKSEIAFDIDVRLCTDKAGSWAHIDAVYPRLFYQCMEEHGNRVPPCRGRCRGATRAKSAFASTTMRVA
ncbi:hypothetical protein [Paludibacterium yongneupense]|uniref:hypothetical protein n=1 Tax=Paludibacterium yongneupense TaxID=400061 RepID=UPI0004033C59|nr:hypothetical protein [Paludibacterium yongneupense]